MHCVSTLCSQEPILRRYLQHLATHVGAILKKTVPQTFRNMVWCLLTASHSVAFTVLLGGFTSLGVLVFSTAACLWLLSAPHCVVSVLLVLSTRSCDVPATAVARRDVRWD